MSQRTKLWTFFIAGVPVLVRELPINNISIFHPRNQAVRERVEPICRNRGFWSAEYKNWVVFEQFRDVVLYELQLLTDSPLAPSRI